EPERGLAVWTSAARDSSDLDDQLLLADLAGRARALDVLDTALGRIRAIEGPDGPNGNYVAAAAILMRDGTHDEKELDFAKVKLRDAEKARPHWAAVPRALGMLEERRGNADEALQYFRRAIELGDRSGDTVQRVVDHLVSKGKFDEAWDEINRAEATAPD